MAYVDRLGDVWRVTAAMTTPTNQTQEINIHFQITAQGSGDSRLLLLSFVDTAWDTFLKAYTSSSCHYFGSKCSAVQTFAPYAPIITRPNTAGTGGAKMLPSQARVLCKVTTDLVGRAYRGRIYGFTPESTMIGTNELPASTITTAWSNFGAAIAAGTIQGGTTWTPVLYHRRRPPQILIDPTPIVSITASGLWGTQRRGGDYGRQNIGQPW